MSDSLSRRHFIQSSAALAASLAVASRGYAANDTINLGVIGCGGRARGALMPALKKMDKVNIVAVCDVYDPRAQAGNFLAGGKAFMTRDHRALLDRKDVDAVVIATPDHWHVPITIDACAAGKDVYVEKPLTHNLAEGAAVIEAQNKHNRIVQVGMQQRSMPQFAWAKQVIAEGLIGPVHKIHMSWNRNFLPFNKPNVHVKPEEVDWQRFCGNAPQQPLDAYRMLDWRWFWDFGNGILTDLMVHWLDGVNMVLDLPLPDTATTIGQNFATEGVWETPDTIQTLFEYRERKIQLHFEGTFVSTYGRAGTTLMGEKGTIYLDRGRYELHGEPNRGIEDKEQIYSDGVRGADFFKVPDGEALHLGTWLDCVRTRNKPNAPAEAGVLAAAGAHMGNMAYRQGKVIRRES